MNGCAPRLNAPRTEDNQLRSTRAAGALTTTGATDKERAVKRTRIERPKVRRERALPGIIPLDPRDPDARRAKALVAGAAAT
jgi:hypothetical protein